MKPPMMILGPMLRRCSAQALALTVVLREPTSVAVQWQSMVGAPWQTLQSDSEHFALGVQAHLYQVQAQFAAPQTGWGTYRCIDARSGEALSAAHALCIKPQLDHVVFGSCRRPHHPGSDAIAALDATLDTTVDDADWPAAVVFCGDQVYLDDVAGPMLRAIWQVVDMLGLYGPEPYEKFSPEALRDVYARRNLLPKKGEHGRVQRRVFGGTRKPVFTTATPDNHLLLLQEIVAMYLLVWSPALWPLLELSAPAKLSPSQRRRYHRERQCINEFVSQLAAVQRALARVPTYMIFDDHDVTDDWNISHYWTEVALSHPASRSMIGDALVAYWLFQAWGNDPQRVAALAAPIQAYLQDPTPPQKAATHAAMLAFHQWDYQTPHDPPMRVLDTRTEREPRLDRPRHPSGLMQLNKLEALKAQLYAVPSVVLVSAAPVFGLKAIEWTQALGTSLGLSQLVDSENWMAHDESGGSLLELFADADTAQNIVILSGDVHYGFVSDVSLRSAARSPDIWQLTSSGLRNTFPDGLLRFFARIDAWAFRPESPLNRLTKRWALHVSMRQCSDTSAQRVLNGSQFGRVWLKNGELVRAESVLAAGGARQWR